MRLALFVAALALWGSCKIRVPDGTETVGEFPCTSAEECPAPPNACLLSACWDEQCVYVPAPEGSLPEEAQVAGDCKELYCDGQGEIVASVAQRDVPGEDDNPCTDGICDVGTPRQAPKIAGARCGEGICNGGGICGVCLPKESRCEGHAVTTCGAEGQWSSPAACDEAAPRCHRARCVGVEEIAAGSSRACARFSDGSVLCWGAPLGSPTPKPAFDGVDWGPHHACGIRAGEVHCWGAGDWGQLGHGRHASSSQPVATGVEATAVAVGRHHSCALTPEGKVHCWGRNDRGQLGHGRPAPEAVTPLPLAGGSATPFEIAAEGVSDLELDGATTCLDAKCWGIVYPLPADPEVDDPEPDQTAFLTARQKISSAAPAPVPGLAATALDCGLDHCCALLGDGSVRCWGGGDRGQLGRAGDASPTPVTIAGVSATRLAVGHDFACALSGAGVVCWGDDSRGQLGGSGGPAPASIPLDGPARELVAGADFACVLEQAGSVRCWGRGAAPAAIGW